MYLDVVDLRAFYYRTKLGRSAQRALQEALRRVWPETRALTVVGFGFAAPMLRPFLSDARRVVALMPAQQGVMPWPPGGPNVSTLVEETRWPVSAGSIDRVIVAHGLETCAEPGALLDEIWRVLKPGGRAVFIVPNRSGIWARRDITPFGYGRPYSAGQLEGLVRKHRLEPGQTGAALYGPPSHRRFWLQTAQLWERLGRRFEPRVFAGALLVEVTKQVYARPDSSRSRVCVPGPLEVLEGLAGGKPDAVASRRVMPAEGPERADRPGTQGR